MTVCSYVPYKDSDSIHSEEGSLLARSPKQCMHLLVILHPFIFVIGERSEPASEFAGKIFCFYIYLSMCGRCIVRRLQSRVRELRSPHAHALAWPS